MLARTCTLVSLSSQRQYTAHPRSFVNPRSLSLSFYLVLFVRSLARKLAHHSRFVQLGPRSLVPAQRLPAPLHGASARRERGDVRAAHLALHAGADRLQPLGGLLDGEA